MTTGSGISPLNERGSGRISAVHMNEGHQLRVSRRSGIIALENEASLRWTLSAERRYVRLPVLSRFSTKFYSIGRGKTQ